MAESIVSVNNVSKNFDTVKALKNVSLEIKEGEFLTLLGPSGCGKTTLLRIIAGLETPSNGTVSISGRDVTNVEPHLRPVNTVFQSYALFPHMNVFDNIAYGLKVKKTPTADIKKKVGEMLSLVKLSGYENRTPAQLSGGQRQRVAIARAIVNDPAILLLDEPLGALDLQLRRSMQHELKHLQQQLGITFLYITHDQEEALNMSDRIGVMNEGEILQLGTPDYIYDSPKNTFVARFIGQSNIIKAKVHSGGRGNLILSYGGGFIVAEGEAEVGESVMLSVRQERVRYTGIPTKGFSLTGVIKESIYTGGVQRTVLSLPDGEELISISMGGTELRGVTGTTVGVHWEPSYSVVLERGV